MLRTTEETRDDTLLVVIEYTLAFVSDVTDIHEQVIAIASRTSEPCGAVLSHGEESPYPGE